MKRLLPGLIVLASLAALPRQPRFLGPPVRRDSGTDPEKPVLNVGDHAPLRGGVLYNPEAAGQRFVEMSDWIGQSAREPARAIVVTFFSASFEPCTRDLSTLQALYTEYKKRGLRVISFVIDPEPGMEAVLRELLAHQQISFPMVKDTSRVVAREYLGDQLILPAVFLLDGSGKILFVEQGYEGALEGLRPEMEKRLPK